MSVGTCMLTRKKTGENRKFPNISDLLLLFTKYSYQNILVVNSSNWYISSYRKLSSDSKLSYI